MPEGSNRDQQEPRGIWRWLSRRADALKALAAIAITPCVAIFGWQIQASVADQAATAELAQSEAEQAAADDLALRREQFEDDQLRLTHEFEALIAQKNADRAALDRDAQYVGLAVGILSEPVRNDDELQHALREYAIDILVDASPIDIPPEIAEAVVDGDLPLPLETLVPGLVDPAVRISPAALDLAIDDLFELRACSPTDRLGCLFGD